MNSQRFLSQTVIWNSDVITPILTTHPGIYTKEKQYSVIIADAYLTTSTAPGLTFGSLPMIDTLAVNDPSIENSTTLECGGNTRSDKSVKV